MKLPLTRRDMLRLLGLYNAESIPGEREIYATSFRFVVEIEGMEVAGFSEVLGLQVETEVEEYQEGGVNDYVHRFPKTTTYPSLVLKKGITLSNDLWEWYEGVIVGNIEEKSGSIILQDFSGEEMRRWHFYNAYPIKWVGPELRASSSEVAVESLEIVHTGLSLAT